MLDALEAAIEGRASKTQLKREYDGMAIEHMILIEEVILRDRYRLKYQRELAGPKGNSGWRTIKPRVTAPVLYDANNRPFSVNRALRKVSSQHRVLMSGFKGANDQNLAEGGLPAHRDQCQWLRCPPCSCTGPLRSHQIEPGALIENMVTEQEIWHGQGERFAIIITKTENSFTSRIALEVERIEVG